MAVQFEAMKIHITKANHFSWRMIARSTLCSQVSIVAITIKQSGTSCTSGLPLCKRDGYLETCLETRFLQSRSHPRLKTPKSRSRSRATVSRIQVETLQRCGQNSEVL